VAPGSAAAAAAAASSSGAPSFATLPSGLSGLTPGLSMLGSSLPSVDVVAKMRKGLNPEELTAAFARR
jgi:hypothetical protein